MAVFAAIFHVEERFSSSSLTWELESTCHTAGSVPRVSVRMSLYGQDAFFEVSGNLRVGGNDGGRGWCGRPIIRQTVIIMIRWCWINLLSSTSNGCIISSFLWSLGWWRMTGTKNLFLDIHHLVMDPVFFLHRILRLWKWSPPDWPHCWCLAIYSCRKVVH